MYNLYLRRNPFLSVILKIVSEGEDDLKMLHFVFIFKLANFNILNLSPAVAY